MTLSFNYTFQHVNDEIICAYTQPYTYSSLLSHIKSLKLLAADCPYEILKFETFGTSLGNLEIPILKVSNNST